MRIGGNVDAQVWRMLFGLMLVYGEYKLNNNALGVAWSYCIGFIVGGSIFEKFDSVIVILIFLFGGAYVAYKMAKTES